MGGVVTYFHLFYAYKNYIFYCMLVTDNMCFLFLMIGTDRWRSKSQDGFIRYGDDKRQSYFHSRRRFKCTQIC